MNLPKVADYFFISTVDPSKTLQECRIKTPEELAALNADQVSNNQMNSNADTVTSTPGNFSELKLEDEFWNSFISSAESDLSLLSKPPKPNASRHLTVQTKQVFFDQL
jgi:hypothetical protein